MCTLVRKYDGTALVLLLKRLVVKCVQPLPYCIVSYCPAGEVTRRVELKNSEGFDAFFCG